MTLGRVVIFLVSLIVAASVITGIYYNMNGDVMQIIGSIVGEIPFFGRWLSGLAGLTNAVLTSYDRSAYTVFSIMLDCVISNWMDSLLIGFIYSALRKIPYVNSGARRYVLDHFLGHNGMYRAVTMFLSTVVAVLVLFGIKQIRSDEWQIIFRGGLNIALLLLGIGMMLGLGRSMRGGAANFALAFLADAVLGAFEAVAVIGIICSLFYIPTALRVGLPMLGYVVWIVYIVLFIVLICLIDSAYDKRKEMRL